MFQPNTSCLSVTAKVLVTNPECTDPLEGMVQFCSSRCRVVGLPGGGTGAPHFVTGMLEAPVHVFAVVGSGRMCLCPEALPVAGTRPG